MTWGKDHDYESDGGLSGDGMSESDEDLCFDDLDDNYTPEDSDIEHLDDEVQSECVEFIWKPPVSCQIPSYICNGLITNLRTQSFSIWRFLTTFDSRLSVLSTLKVNDAKFHPYLGEKFHSNSSPQTSPVFSRQLLASTMSALIAQPHCYSTSGTGLLVPMKAIALVAQSSQRLTSTQSSTILAIQKFGVVYEIFYTGKRISGSYRSIGSILPNTGCFVSSL